MVGGSCCKVATAHVSKKFSAHVSKKFSKKENGRDGKILVGIPKFFGRDSKTFW